MIIEYDVLGKACQNFRRSLGCTQKEVARDCFVTLQSVSNFECGKNASFTILMWYLIRGFDVRESMGVRMYGEANLQKRS